MPEPARAGGYIKNACQKIGRRSDFLSFVFGNGCGEIEHIAHGAFLTVSGIIGQLPVEGHVGSLAPVQIVCLVDALLQNKLCGLTEGDFAVGY